MAQYPVVKWDNFMRHFQWRQGEHVIAVAPTGGGKTTLFSRILDRRLYVVMFVTKLRDETIKKQFSKYTVIHRWQDIRQVKVGQPNRYLLWPAPGRTTRETVMRQREVFEHALDRIYLDGGWAVVIDEEHYLSEMLRLEGPIKLYLHQARSSNLSMVNGTQRPAFVPVITYPSSTHGFLWRTTEKTDLDRIATMGVQRAELAQNLARLRKHQFIYVNTRNPDASPIITQVEGV